MKLLSRPASTIAGLSWHPIQVATAAALVILAGCTDAVDPPNTLEGDYYAVWSAFGELPVRIDQYIGNDWFTWVEDVDLHFETDGSYEMVIAVRDSFPNGRVWPRDWVVAGSYEIKVDTVINFEIDPENTSSKIGPSEGRLRPRRTLWISMLGLLFYNRENEGV